MFIKGPLAILNKGIIKNEKYSIILPFLTN